MRRVTYIKQRNTRYAVSPPKNCKRAGRCPQGGLEHIDTTRSFSRRKETMREEERREREERRRGEKRGRERGREKRGQE